MVKTKKRFVCEECEKELKSKRALVGHMWFAHGKRTGEKASLYDNIKTLENEKGTNPDTIERIEKIEDLVEKLVEMMKDQTKIMREFGEVVFKLASRPANPGSPGRPGDPNPKEVKPDEEKVKSDDEKESEKTADEKSWFL